MKFSNTAVRLCGIVQPEKAGRFGTTGASFTAGEGNTSPQLIQNIDGALVKRMAQAALANSHPDEENADKTRYLPRTGLSVSVFCCTKPAKDSVSQSIENTQRELQHLRTGRRSASGALSPLRSIGFGSRRRAPAATVFEVTA